MRATISDFPREHPSVTLIDLDRIPLRRALISVYDKTGLPELARGLHAAGVSLVSTLYTSPSPRTRTR
ncbi:hypothetical protein SA12R_09920, partial [Rothia kristinae]